MNPTPEAAAADGDEDRLDPRDAAVLLEQATRQARRRLQPSPPWLLAARAVAVLVALGVIWLTVRGQHPYRGPTAADIPVLVGFIVINFAATVAVRRQATAGVSGRSRMTQGEIAALLAAFAVTVVAMTGLAATGAKFATYPTSVLVLPGLTWAVLTAARGRWRGAATGLAIVVTGVVGAFTGPAAAWAVAGVGLCAVLLGNAAVIAWHQRA